jgi:hypothetical protein
MISQRMEWLKRQSERKTDRHTDRDKTKRKREIGLMDDRDKVEVVFLLSLSLA